MTVIDTSPRQRHPVLILVICCMSLLLVSLDATIVNVALPSIRAQLHADVSSLQWTIDAYTLVLAALLLLSGTTSDRIGRRRTFQIGLAIFGLGSLLCGFAPSIGWLIAFRALQAIGGSMLNPVAMSIITAVFEDPARRARAVGVWSAVVGVSLALGPILGGALLAVADWRVIFWVNVPVVIAALILTAIFVPEIRARRARRFDPIGQLAIGAFVACTVGGLIEGPRRGWDDWLPLTLFGVAVAALVVLIAYELRRADAVLDPRLFRSLPFSNAVVTAIAAFAGNGAFLFLMTLYLQDVRGFTPLVAGLHLLPMAATQLVCGPLSGRLVARFGTRPSLLLAAGFWIVAFVALAFLADDTPQVLLLVTFGVFGIGQGFVNAAITTAAVSGMPLSRAGSAAAIASTSRQVGVSLGVALAGTITGIGAATTISAGFSEATHAMWWTMVGVSAAVLVLSFLATGPVGRRSREGIRSLLEETGSVRTSEPSPEPARG
jgi:EmrB/QacA subfamily drug resistance transporter